MSTNEGHRFKREVPTYPDIDYKKPIDLTKIKMTEATDCFGKEYDPTAKECIDCADNDICGIKFGSAVREKVTEMEKINKYLDLSDWTLVLEEDLHLWLGMRARSTDQALDKVLAMAKSTDEVAGVEHLRRFLTKHKYIVKEGMIYAK